MISVRRRASPTGQTLALDKDAVEDAGVRTLPATAPTQTAAATQSRATHLGPTCEARASRSADCCYGHAIAINADETYAAELLAALDAPDGSLPSGA